MNSALNYPPGGPTEVFASVYNGNLFNNLSASSPFPLLITSITPKRVTVTTAASVIGSGSWKYIIDIWLVPPPGVFGNSRLQMEIVLQHFNSGLQAGSLISSNTSLGGSLHSIYSTGVQNSVIYVLNVPVTSVDRLDLYPYIQDAVSRGYVPSSWSLIGIQAGFVIYQGGTGLALTSFSVSGNSTSYASSLTNSTAVVPPALKESSVFEIVAVTPNLANNAWTVFFQPMPSVIPITGDHVISLPRPSSPRWLGSLGHVTGLKYAYTCPGGPSALSCTLQVPPDFRTDALDPGRVVQVFRGGGCVWDGILDEPQPAAAGWTITAHGAGAFGTDFAAVWNQTVSANDPAWNADDAINQAIVRGLRWVNPGIGTGPAGNPVYLAQQVDSGSQTVTDHLNLLTTGGSLLWDVQEGQGSALPSGPWQLRVFPYPTDISGNPNGAPTRLLIATTPVARTIAADINTLVLRYQATPDIPAITDDNGVVVTPAVAATFTVLVMQNAASVRRHGQMEYFLDLTSGGIFSAAQAQVIGNNVLSRYVRANFAGPFTVGPGQYLNPGGMPVDLGCEHAGEVAQLVVTDGSYGGEVGPAPITFIVGTYEFDNDTSTATVTPFAGVRRDIGSLITALSSPKWGP